MRGIFAYLWRLRRGFSWYIFLLRDLGWGFLGGLRRTCSSRARTCPKSIIELFCLRSRQEVRRILLFGGLGRVVLLGFFRLVMDVRIWWRIFTEEKERVCRDSSRSCFGCVGSTCRDAERTKCLPAWWVVTMFLPISWDPTGVQPTVKFHLILWVIWWWVPVLLLFWDCYAVRLLLRVCLSVFPELVMSYILEVGVELIEEVDEDGMEYGDNMEVRGNGLLMGLWWIGEGLYNFSE